VALLDECDGLDMTPISIPAWHSLPKAKKRRKTRIKREEKGGGGTYSLNSLHHPIPHHHHRQPSPAERADSHLPLDPRQTRALLPALLQDAHAPQFLEHLALDLLPDRVRIRVQLGQPVRQLPQGAAQRVVLLVVERVLEVVSSADDLLAVVGVGFVGREVDFAEESAMRSR